MFTGRVVKFEIQKPQLNILTCRPEQDALADVLMYADAIVMNMSKLAFIDSCGLEIILSAVMKTQGRVYIWGLSGQPKEIFRILKLGRLIKVYTTEAEAEHAAHTEE